MFSLELIRSQVDGSCCIKNVEKRWVLCVLCLVLISSVLRHWRRGQIACERRITFDWVSESLPTARVRPMPNQVCGVWFFVIRVLLTITDCVPVDIRVSCYDISTVKFIWRLNAVVTLCCQLSSLSSFSYIDLLSRGGLISTVNTLTSLCQLPSKGGSG